MSLTFVSTPSRLFRPAQTTAVCSRRPFTMLAEGSKAPDFTRAATDGAAVTLSALLGHNVVLYFSNASGPGCTAQSCSFRDAAADLAALDAKIIGVSAQNGGKTTKFIQSNQLPFPMIPDTDRSLQNLYEVPSTLGLIPGRVTYVIDAKGIIRSIYNSQFGVAQHVVEAKKTLSSL